MHNHLFRGVRNGLTLMVLFWTTLFFLVALIVGAAGAQAPHASAEMEATAPLAISDRAPAR